LPAAVINQPPIAAAGNSSAVDAFLATHQTIKVLPENTTRILRIVNDPNCNAQQLLSLITADAALTGAIMKAVNSSFYSLNTKVTRLDRAVAYMGLKAVKELTLSTAVGAVCKPARLGPFDARDLWDHSVAVAVLAREMATVSKWCDAEEAFLAGILHDIALLLVSQSESAKLAGVLTLAAPGGSGNFIAGEAQAFGFDHTQLGGRLAQNWGLEPRLAAAIRWHHEPHNAPPEFAPLCNCIYVADTLCGQTNIGCPLTSAGQALTASHFLSANLQQEPSQAVMAKLPMLLRLHLSF
jgi:putative nucleotidyltransferase with HDIG domain